MPGVAPDPTRGCPPLDPDLSIYIRLGRVAGALASADGFLLAPARCGGPSSLADPLATN
jgi:hypothetical protein